MATSTPIPIVLDLIGTAFSIYPVIEAIGTLSDERHSLNKSVTENWIQSSRAAATHLSLAGNYTPLATILEQSLLTFVIGADLFSLKIWKDEEAAEVMDEDNYHDRFPSVFASFGDLYDMGLSSVTRLLLDFKLNFLPMVSTDGSVLNARKLLDKVGVGKKWKVFSCDEVGKARPAVEVYEALWEKAGMKEQVERSGWYISEDMGELHAAKRAGFKTIWISGAGWGELPLPPKCWGEHDLVAKGVVEAVELIVELESKRKANEEQS